MKYTEYSSSNRHALMVSSHVYSRLKSRGHFGESFSNLISRILDELDAANRQGRAKN